MEVIIEGQVQREVKGKDKGLIVSALEDNKVAHFNFDFAYDEMLDNDDNSDQYL